jgi:hypothetical protein
VPEIAARNTGIRIMIRDKIAGSIYTLPVTLRRNRNSSASVDNFSTYDSMTDSYPWQIFESYRYILFPAGRNKNHFYVTLYLQTLGSPSDTVLRRTARTILKEHFIHHLCGVAVEKIETPCLFLRTIGTEHRTDLNPESRAERIFDFITHF